MKLVTHHEYLIIAVLVVAVVDAVYNIGIVNVSIYYININLNFKYIFIVF